MTSPIREQIIAHLFEYHKWLESTTVPEAVTQRGIIEALYGYGEAYRKQGLISYTLKSLVADGLVVQRRGRPSVAKRLLKTYFLSSSGIDYICDTQKSSKKQSATLESVVATGPTKLDLRELAAQHMALANRHAKLGDHKTAAEIYMRALELLNECGVRGIADCYKEIYELYANICKILQKKLAPRLK